MSNPNFSITRANLIRYASANPIEFSMLKGYSDMNLSHWTQAQQEAYFDWSEAQANRAVNRTGYVDDVDALSQYTAKSEIDRVLAEFGEEAEFTGFGPGSYKGGYTGHGDTIYWGPQDGSSSASTNMTDLTSEFHSSVSMRSQLSHPDSFTTERSVAPRTAEDFVQFAEGGPSTASMPPTESSYPTMPSVSEYVPTELPENLVGMRNQITPYETAGAASSWDMGAEMHSQTYVSSLDSLPEIPELDAGMLSKLGIPKPEMTKILNDSYVETNASGVGSYNLNRFVNGIVGAAANIAVVTPVLNWVRDNLGVVGQGVAGTVNIYGAASMFGIIGDMDPVGLAVQAAMVGINAFNDQSRRKRDNDYSGKLDSSRAMMVRDGGKWYPAFIVNRTEDESLMFPGTDFINVRYGRPEDLYFVREAGQTKAFFKNQKNRQFRMDPETWSTDRGSYDWMKEKDPLRGFYFLSPEHTENLLQGYGTKDFAWKVLDDETSESSSDVGKQMLDLQSALEFIQDSQRKAGSPDEYMVSPTRGLKRAFGVRRKFGYGEVEKWEEEDTSTHGYNEWKTNGLTEFARKILPENMLALEDYRRMASDSVDGSWWKAYTDSDKDIPMANNLDELKAQYELIDGYNDRNVAQKDYLKQKAGVRYQMSVVNQMNVGFDLYDELNKQAYSMTDLFSDKHSELYNHPDKYLDTEGGMDGDLLYSSTHWGLFPIKSMWTEDAGYDFAAVGSGTSKANTGLRHLPSWYNKGDGLLPAGMDLGSYNDSETGWDDWSGNNKTALDNWVEENGDFINSVISDAGAKTNDAYIIKSYHDKLDNDVYQDTLAKMKRDSEAAVEAGKPDPFIKFVMAAEQAKDSPEEQARRLENTYFTGKFGHKSMKKYREPGMDQEKKWEMKQEGKYVPRDSKQLKDERMRQARAEGVQKEVEQEAQHQQSISAAKAKHAKTVGLKTTKDFSTHFVSGELKGQEITYNRWKQQAATGMLFDPSNVGESSWQHAAESILLSDAWIPKNVPLSEENFPSWWVDLNDEQALWKPLLQHIDKLDDPAMKQRANYIHNLVGDKDTQQYLERFHPHQTMNTNSIAKDLAGTHAQLSDDWSAPYKPHMNSVMFNHTLHSQLDVNVVETY